jgi:hypothetical protein
MVILFVVFYLFTEKSIRHRVYPGGSQASALLRFPLENNALRIIAGGT